MNIQKLLAFGVALVISAGDVYSQHDSGQFSKPERTQQQLRNHAANFDSIVNALGLIKSKGKFCKAKKTEELGRTGNMVISVDCGHGSVESTCKIEWSQRHTNSKDKYLKSIYLDKKSRSVETLTNDPRFEQVITEKQYNDEPVKEKVSAGEIVSTISRLVEQSCNDDRQTPAVKIRTKVKSLKLKNGLNCNFTETVTFNKNKANKERMSLSNYRISLKCSRGKTVCSLATQVDPRTIADPSFGWASPESYKEFAISFKTKMHDSFSSRQKKWTRPKKGNVVTELSLWMEDNCKESMKL